MNKIIRVEFNLISVSKLYFGSNEQGLLLKDTDNKPFIMGSSIGGCIKSYLEGIEGINYVNKYFGGELNDKTFKESNIIVYDAEIESSNNKLIHEKEGTRINSEKGTAEDNNKYTIEYLEENTKIKIAMEIEINSTDSKDDLMRLMGLIEIGFDNGYLKLGGQINNGFGRIKVEKIILKTVELTNEKELIDYLLYKKYKKKTISSFKSYINNNIKLKKDKIIIKLKGNFPYGVYQNFLVENNISGIQNTNNVYYIPATSIKGLIRNEVEKILDNNSVINKNVKMKTINCIFGSIDNKGAAVFKDIIINNPVIIQTEEEKSFVIYNKIDRLTGGSFNTALIKQKEIRGDATIEFELDRKKSINYAYPLIVILRNISWGIIPLGGRTSIGLGEFHGNKIEINDTKNEFNIKIKMDYDKRNLNYEDGNSKETMKKLMNRFADLKGE